ncbi:MAG: GtrA family protein [Ectothiorhodospiraceae bacterium]|nr:GtrA family protein [Ectothiorhodospiraceae bacterium]
MIATAARFAVSGGLATLTHVSVAIVMIEWFSVRPVFAAGIAFAVALVISYSLNYHWTFSASGPHRVMLPRFVLVAILGLLLNIGITYSVVDMAGYWYGYALMLVVISVPIMTFVLSKLWVFVQAE